ncbi:MAG: hypothetical protein K2X87_02575 [Gemmataceae bacterium]|nr:hypothetical protein [Gemmataceae bacterium]
MRRFLGVLFAAGLAAAPADAKLVAAPKPPAQRAVTADAVVVGTVTSVEPAEVEAAPYPGAEEKVKFKVAVVKVTDDLAGAGGLTHLRVGFVPPMGPPPVGTGGVPRPRRGLAPPELKEGAEFLFFLAKHPDAGFYLMPVMSPPVEAKDGAAKDEVAAVRKVLAVVADPVKALKADKAEDRHAAAVALLGKYRAYPEFGGEVDQVPIPAEESRLILKALAEGDWARFQRDRANAMQAFYSLGLSEADGWNPPNPRPAAPGQPVDINALTKKSFEAWRTGPGKDYVVKKVVAKKK